MSPTSAQHNTNADGSVTVIYRYPDGQEIRATYISRRDASIESTLTLFPGTSREWLENMHRG